LFTISNLTIRADYYTNTLNYLVEMLNKNLVNQISSLNDSNEFVRIFDFEEKFVKLKRSFLKEFWKTNKQFNFSKFSSFGKYFFNNLYEIIPDPNIISTLTFLTHILIIYRNKLFSNRNEFTWKNFGEVDKHTKINDSFSIYFNSKLLNWKVGIIKETKEKSNTCRVCEKKFSSKEFIIHSWFCKEINSFVPEIKKFSNKIGILLEELKSNKE
jgi:hypothetical protein